MIDEEGSFSRFFDIEESRVDDPAPLRSSKTRHLYDWWLKSGDGKLPLRRRFDIVDHKRIIANVLLIEVRPDRKFVFRLLGEEAIAILGQNWTGEVVRPGRRAEYGHALEAYYRRIVEAKSCRRRVGRLSSSQIGPGSEIDSGRFEAVDCPLSSDGTSVDAIIGVMDIIG